MATIMTVYGVLLLHSSKQLYVFVKEARSCWFVQNCWAVGCNSHQLLDGSPIIILFRFPATPMASPRTTVIEEAGIAYNTDLIGGLLWDNHLLCRCGSVISSKVYLLTLPEVWGKAADSLL